LDLVTGGAGFIGQHLVRELLAAGRRVRVLDPRPGPADVAAEWRQGSILDGQALASALEGVERVFHLAAIPHFWCKDKQAHNRVNVEGTEAVLAAMRTAGVRRLVHCSTEAVLLPESGGRTIDGSRSPRLAAMPGPYTRSKLLAEEAVMAAEDLEVAVVSPTAPIGAGDSGPTPPMRMLGDLLAGRYPAYLDCRLNLVDVRDVALGHRLAAERGKPGRRYILGGENVAFSELLRRLATISGRPMPRRRIPGWLALASAQVATALADHVTGRPPSATPEAVRLALAGADLSSGLAERELGYRPRPFDEALGAAVAALAASGRGGG